ncbi:MAG: hypothetical protein H8D46_01875 [FCB group bacterium]|nr:hypothetical protein [FCB group bacterium]
MCEKFIGICVGEDQQFWRGGFCSTPQFLIYDYHGNFLEMRPNTTNHFKNESLHQYQIATELLKDCRTIVAFDMSRQCKARLVEENDIHVFLDDFELEPSEIAKRFIGKSVCS